MPSEFACRKPGCRGLVRGAPAADSMTCPECGAVYRVKRKPPGAGATFGLAAADDPGPSRPPAADALPAPQRKKRKRRPAEAEDHGGAGFGATVRANLPFLLT